MIENNIGDIWNNCRRVRKSAWKASANYYWIVDEMEAAGHYLRLAHPLEAKKRMGKTGKKTDKVDANGLSILLRRGMDSAGGAAGSAGVAPSADVYGTAVDALEESDSGSFGTL